MRSSQDVFAIDPKASCMAYIFRATRADLVQSLGKKPPPLLLYQYCCCYYPTSAAVAPADTSTTAAVVVLLQLLLLLLIGCCYIHQYCDVRVLLLLLR